MQNLASQLTFQQVSQEIGTVRRIDQDHLAVVTPSGEVRCHRAVSCLVEPKLDDTVLVAAADDGRAWVLAVLDRDDRQTTRVAVEGDLELRLRDGSFTVAAQNGVGIVAGQEVSVVSGRFHLNAVNGSVALQRLTYVGRLLHSEIERVKSFADTLDSVLGRLSQRVKRSYRTVEELEQLKARQLDVQVETTMSLRGENTLVTAEKLVKVDGEQIHLG